MQKGRSAFSHCSLKNEDDSKIEEKYGWMEDITYIERENAESIVLFNVARGSKLVKCALGHPEAQFENGLEV